MFRYLYKCLNLKQDVIDYFRNHPETYLYIADNKYVADACGPMGPGRYTAIDDFINYDFYMYIKDEPKKSLKIIIYCMLFVVSEFLKEYRRKVIDYCKLVPHFFKTYTHEELCREYIDINKYFPGSGYIQDGFVYPSSSGPYRTGHTYTEFLYYIIYRNYLNPGQYGNVHFSHKIRAHIIKEQLINKWKAFITRFKENILRR